MPTQASGLGGEWHSSARAAVTSHHKLDDLANRYSLAVLESGCLKFKVLSKTVLSPRFWVEAFLVSSLFLGVAADPGCPLACKAWLQALPLLLRSLPVCLSSCHLPLLKRMTVGLDEGPPYSTFT